MKIHGHLGFELTKQEQNRSETFDDFSLAIVKDWLNELPNTNQGVMAKSMYEFLIEFNRTKISSTSRYETLETLLPQIIYLSQKMTEHYLQDAELTHDKKRKISLLIEALSLEICMGFKLIIDELSKKFRKNKVMLTKCLHHLSILYLDLLQKSFQMYSNPPTYLWREYHIIYQVADKNRILTKEVEHFDARPIRHNTILDAYKHALLLACTNPFRLRGRELYKINFALEHWAPMLNLVKYTKHSTDIFVVNLLQDSPPRYAHLTGESSKATFGLQLEKVNQRIALLLKHYSHDDTVKADQSLLPCEYHLPLNVLSFLKTSWTKPSERGADRIPQAGNIRVTVGLNSAFAAIQSHLDEAFGPITTTATNDGEITEEIYFDNVPLPQQEENTHHLEFDFTSTSLINISPTGLCIELTEPFPNEFKTGEIIALEQNPENECQFSVGIICWIKQLNAKKAQCGIKLLSPYAQPILSIIPEQTNQLGIKTLLLPAEPSFQPFVTLLTPSLPFKEGTTILVAHGDTTYPIYLESIVDSSSSINQFHIECQNGQDFPFLKFNHSQDVGDLFKNMDL